jgi:hypothetical protein
MPLYSPWFEGMENISISVWLMFLLYDIKSAFVALFLVGI